MSLSSAEPVAQLLDGRSLALRRMIIDTLVSAGRGHPGPALSLVEILRVLYDDILRIRPEDPAWNGRDRLILSKGHGCLALYAVLADKGFFPKDELKRFCRFGSFLGGHPEAGKIPGVEASTGALGHGLPIGVGMALAARLQKRDSRVFVVTGDGELNEGSMWEAAMSASKNRLDALTAIVDYNKLQSYGSVDSVQPLEPLADKWRAFGFAVAEVNGHNVVALQKVLSCLPLEVGKPSVVIAHTIKGKGVPVAENNPQWHHKNKLSADELASVSAALGDMGNA
jgi:transketolase